MVRAIQEDVSNFRKESFKKIVITLDFETDVYEFIIEPNDNLKEKIDNLLPDFLSKRSVYLSYSFEK